LDSNADRVEQLRRRFHAPKVAGRPADQGVERVKYSMWLSEGIIAKIDFAYRQLYTKLFPNKVTKGAYMEAVFEIGLKHEAEVEAFLRDRYPTEE
jgi:hypothetical protein